MNTCENNPSCERIGTRVIGGVTFIVYFCLDTDSYEEYSEEAPLAPAPGKEGSGQGE